MSPGEGSFSNGASDTGNGGKDAAFGLIAYEPMDRLCCGAVKVFGA